MWRVIGQNRAVSLLQRSLETGSLAHAYLFIGPAHVGKMTLALNLAQALNCEEEEVPCGECASCQKIASTGHADVQIIGLNHNLDSAEAKPRAEISIEQIRQLQHSASLPPFEGKYRVFIIDGAEHLSNEAANCLLKTLEEPVGKTVFILMTINDNLLPATVISRCQRVELLPLAVAEVEDALNKVWGIEPQKAKFLAGLSRGCLGWAVAARVDDSLLQGRSERLDELIGVIEAGYEERFALAARLATQFSQNRESVQERLDEWLDWWHDMLLVKTGLNDSVTNVDYMDKLVDMKEVYNLVHIRTFINNVQEASRQLRLNASPRLVLEVLMLNIPLPEKRLEGRLAA